MRFFRGDIDRRVIYALVLLALALPILTRFTVPPARMAGADRLYDLVDGLTPKAGEIAFVALDFGPNTIAENGTQAEVVVEHLLRKRIPFVLFSQYALAEPFLNSIPEQAAARLMHEQPGAVWRYGVDWVNLGYRPGGYLVIQAIPKAATLAELFKRDVRGSLLQELPLFQGVGGLESVKHLAQFTGLVGVFDTYVQFMQRKDYRPLFGHGCTSITIPEAFIYVDSGQIQGLLEGIAGAAWYSERLRRAHTARAPDTSAIVNTGLGVAHLVIIVLIIVGNVVSVWQRGRR